MSNRAYLTLILLAAGALLGYGVAQGSVLALVIVPALLIAAAAVVWPTYTLLLMLAYVPFESFLLKWVPGGQGGILSLAPEGLLFLAGVSALMRDSGRPEANSRRLWLLWIALFLAVGAVSGWIAGVHMVDVAYWVRTNVRYMTAALIVGTFGDREWWVTRASVVIAVTAVLESLVAVAEFIGGSAVIAFFAPASVVVGGREFVRYSAITTGGVAGTLAFYNNYGLYCALAAVVCGGALIIISDTPSLKDKVSIGVKRLLAFAVLGSVVGTLISQSRQSIIALAAAGVVILFVVGIRRIGNRLIPILFGGAVLVLATLLVPSLAGPLAWIPERFQQVTSGVAVNQSLQTDRLFAVSRVVPAALSVNPLLGLGPGALASSAKLGSTASVLGLSAQGILYSQDVGWAGMLVQLGLLGFSTVAGLLLALVRRARQLFKSGAFDHGAAATVLGAMTVWGLGMSASSMLFVRAVSLILWTIAGLCLGGYDARREVEPES
jgi:hypothetical protein